MSKLAIIPARGGSKRIPKKNIKEFFGKPVLAYAIENAINSKLFDEVMVSTDDDEIVEIAIKFGAKVPFKRSSENSDDYATTIDVLTEVIATYGKVQREFEYACCIYPCTPLLTKQRIIEGFSILEKDNLDCVFPIVRYGFPIQRAVRLNDKGFVEMYNPDHLITRSQDLEPSFHDAGQFYFFNVNNLIKKQKLLTDFTGYIEVSEIEVQDIDNLIDWQLAELKYKIINKL
jgi:pseudaminic acid cytidylyltransferase